MHELTHLIGFCADSHSHIDLLDIFSYMGLSEMSSNLFWVKQNIKKWLGV